MNPFSQLIGLALVVHVIVIIVGKFIELWRKCSKWFESTKTLPSYLIIGVITSFVLLMTLTTLVQSITDIHSNVRMAGDFVEAVATTHEVPTPAYANNNAVHSERSSETGLGIFQSITNLGLFQLLIILVAAACAALQTFYSLQKKAPERLY